MVKYPTVRKGIEDPGKSSFEAYRDLVTGDVGHARFALYEVLTSTIGPLPGALGLWLRRKLYPAFLGTSGPGLILGRSLTLRHPFGIRLGAGVTVAMLKCKAGPIRIGPRSIVSSSGRRR
jgi:hypothetical protein